MKNSSLNAIYEEEKKLGQEVNRDAYLDVIFRANPKTFLEVYQMKKYPTVETILTEAGYAPQLIERGRVKGLEQGREQGKAEVARNLLRRGMSVEEIAQVAELPVEKIRAL